MAKQIINNGESGLAVRTKLNSNFTELYDKDTAQDTTISGKSDIGHNHDGVYEPVDGTILRSSDIGNTVERHDVTLVKDASYVHTDSNYTVVEKSKLAGVEDGANNYVHPASHTLSQISDAGTAASKDFGTGANQLVELDASAKLPAVDGINLVNVSNFNNDQENAITGANSPSVTNTFVTENDIAGFGSGDGDMLAFVYDPLGKSADTFAMANMVEDATHKVLTDVERTAIATNSAKDGVTTQQASDITDNTTHRGRIDNPHATTKTHVGLSNVDNTSDANKPLSSASVTALAGKSDTGHNHDGTYEPANSNIQTHVTSPHAPSDAQKNSDITKAEIEAQLTGAITTHSHALPSTVVDRGDTSIENANFLSTDGTFASADDTKVASTLAVKTLVAASAGTPTIYAAGDPGVSVNPANTSVLYVNTTTSEIWHCTDATTDANVWVKTTNVLASNVLEKDNTSAYVPTENYHPATKAYADSVGGGGGGGGAVSPLSDMQKLKAGEFQYYEDGCIGELSGTLPRVDGDMFVTGACGIFAENPTPVSFNTANAVSKPNSRMSATQYYEPTVFTKGGKLAYTLESDMLWRTEYAIPYDLDSQVNVNAAGNRVEVTRPWGTGSNGTVPVFNASGNFFYVRAGNRTNYTYKTATPFEVDGATLYSTGNTYDNGQVFYMSDDGMVIYFVGSGYIKGFLLVNPFDVSALARSFTVPASRYGWGADVDAATFLEDGKYLLVTSGHDSIIHKCATPYVAHAGLSFACAIPRMAIQGGHEHATRFLNEANNISYVIPEGMGVVEYLKTLQPSENYLSNAKGIIQNAGFSPNGQLAVICLNSCFYATVVDEYGALHGRNNSQVVPTSNVPTATISNSGHIIVSWDSEDYVYKFNRADLGGALELLSTGSNESFVNGNSVFNNDGTKVFCLDGTTVYEFAASPAYSLTVSYVGSHTIDNNSSRMCFNTAGTELHTTNYRSRYVHSLGTAFTISTLTATPTDSYSDQPESAGTIDGSYGFTEGVVEEWSSEPFNFTLFGTTHPSVYEFDVATDIGGDPFSLWPTPDGNQVYAYYNAHLYRFEKNASGKFKYTGDSYYLGSGAGDNFSIHFSEDGYNAYVCLGVSAYTITHLQLESAFIIDAPGVAHVITYDYNTLPQFIVLNRSGTKAMIGTKNGTDKFLKIVRYSLSTPFLLSTLTADSGQTFVGTVANFDTFQGLVFYNQPMTFLQLGRIRANNLSAKYVFGTPWDVTTITETSLTSSCLYMYGTQAISGSPEMFMEARYDVGAYLVKTYFTRYVLTNTGAPSKLFRWTSKKIPFSSAPDALNVSLEVPNYMANMGTDFVVEGSRDGGTTWTTALLGSSDGPLCGATELVYTIDTSGQPSGTTIIIRAKLGTSIDSNKTIGLKSFSVRAG